MTSGGAAGFPPRCYPRPVEPRYGPPPDPREVLAPTAFADAPGAWIACVVLGVALAAWARDRRPLLFVLGATVALTTPLAWFLPTYVYGAFPTIDKAGSLLFYLDGVHTRLLEDDPAVRLIGVHLGHLWVTALFDLWLEPFAAMNAHGLLNLVLGWWAAARLVEAVTGDRRVGLLLGFPFGLGLHQFRDLNWYTIEKSGVAGLALYLWALWAARGGDRRAVGLAAAVGGASFFYNVYLGLLCALAGGMALAWRERRSAAAVGLTALAMLPMVALQWRLMHGEGALASPERFVAERAALDVVELWPPRWNRLEAWRALDLVALGLAGFGVWRRAGRWWGLVALVATAISLGPQGNPLYAALLAAVPGFWRVAKPEVFFHLAWLALLVAAGVELTARRVRPLTLLLLAAVFVAGWIAGVRTHPVYPRFTQPLPLTLAPDWEQALPPRDTEPR